MMKFYPSLFVFISSNIFGFVMIISSNNWFFVWMGFEISVLSFLPMFVTSSLSIEGMSVYFVVQAVGSALFLSSFMTCLSVLSLVLFYAGLILKLGLFPFFFWVPLVMNSISWVSCLFLVTLQKLGPLFVLLSTNLVGNVSYWVLLLSVFSVLFSGILGFNQMFLRSLMGYSSIAHTGLLVSIVCLSNKLFISYLLIYFSLTFFLFLIFYSFNMMSVVSSVSGLFGDWGLVLSVFMLVGLPPFSVFFLKMSVFGFLCSYPVYIFIIILGFSVSVYYYFTVIIPVMLKPSYNFFNGLNLFIKFLSGFLVFSVSFVVFI